MGFFYENSKKIQMYLLCLLLFSYTFKKDMKDMLILFEFVFKRTKNKFHTAND